MKNTLLVVILISVAFFAACSKKNSPGKSKFIPTTYTIDVAPLIQAKCTPCHLPSKGGRKANFETYEGTKKFAEDILARVQLNPTDRGFMPFKHDKLPAEEIQIFKKWLEQGMQEK